MAVSRYLGFYRTANIAIRSADPENPEPNMDWIGCTVCEIFAVKLYCDLETGVQGHSRSLKAALFNRTHTTLYSSSIANMPYRFRIRDTAAYWLKIAPPILFGAPVRGQAVRFIKQPLVTKKLKCWAYQMLKECRYVQPF